jgi:integrase
MGILFMNQKTSKMTHDLSLRNEASSQMARPASESLRHYLQAATSDNTRKAYRSAIRQFEKWGGRLPTDRDTVVRYLLARTDSLNPRTLNLHLTAISQWHHYQGVIDPVRDPLVRKTMEGIRRTHGRPKHKAKALRLEHIAEMVKYLTHLPDSKKKHRDIALVLTGFFGAFRRSELVSIQISDLVWEPEGLLIQLPRSKTDQQAAGLMRALPYGPSSYCPAKSIRRWMDTADIVDGPLFRAVNRWDQVKSKQLNPGAINDLLKKMGQACQFEFALDLSSHSFRRGLSTSAARERIDFELIKKQGGWRNDTTVWEYIEEGQQFSNNASLILMEKLNMLVNTD